MNVELRDVNGEKSCSLKSSSYGEAVVTLTQGSQSIELVVMFDMFVLEATLDDVLRSVSEPKIFSILWDEFDFRIVQAKGDAILAKLAEAAEIILMLSVSQIETSTDPIIVTFAIETEGKSDSQIGRYDFEVLEKLEIQVTYTQLQQFAEKLLKVINH
jgi:hypothetical protein